MKLPIIILSKERPEELTATVNSIVDRTPRDSYRIIICDNGSELPESKDALKSLEAEHRVIYNKENLLFEGLNPGLALVDTDYFVITDPDIKLNIKMPKDWVHRFIGGLKEYPTPKLGVAINIGFDVENETTKAILMGCEPLYYTEQKRIFAVDAPCYVAPIDTTFAMYRTDTYSFWKDGLSFGPGKGVVGVHLSQDDYNPKYSSLPRFYSGVGSCIRVGGDYTAEHLGWDVYGKYKEERLKYTKVCNKQVASTLNWRNQYA